MEIAGLLLSIYFVSLIICYATKKKKILEEILDVEEIKKQSKGILKDNAIMLLKAFAFSTLLVAFVYFSLVYIDGFHLHFYYVYILLFIAQVAISCLMDKGIKMQKYLFILLLLPVIGYFCNIVNCSSLTLFAWIGLTYIVSLAIFHLPKKKKIVEENIEKGEGEIATLNKELLKELKIMLFRVAIITTIFSLIIYIILIITVGSNLAEDIIYPLTFAVQIAIAYSVERDKKLYRYGAIILSISLVLALLIVYGLNYMSVKIVPERMVKNRYSVENIYRFYVDNYSNYEDLDIDLSVLEERYRLITPQTHFTIKSGGHKEYKITVIAKRTKGDRNREITFVLKNNFDTERKYETYFRYW